MEERRRTWFTARGIALAGEAARHLDVFAGEIHYWRHEPETWPRCLAAMRALGLEIAATYVPWRVHERAAGKASGAGGDRLDWTGARDLGAFLDRVADAGLRAIVKPGPHVNAELTGFGFPDRVLRAPEVQARTARDTPVWMPAPPRMFPVPSYASPAFQREVAAWFAAVADVIQPRLWPDGPVIAIQVDNEAQMFFRLGAFDHDYAAGALAWWGEVSGGLDPPRRWDPDDAERCARWVQFKEVYVARSLEWLGRALDDAGLRGVARFHNLPPSEPVLINAPRTQRALGDGGLVGLDFYHRAADYEACRRRALYLVGSCRPLPVAWEVGAGGPPWLPPMSHDDQRAITLGLLAAGVRGFDLFMTVERERWYGAPIDARGEPRPIADWYRRLLAALREVEWTALRRRVPVAVVVSRADARFAIASSAADPISPVVLEALGGVLGDGVGLGAAGSAELALDREAGEHRRWLARIQRALDLAQIPYELVDEDCDADVLSGYRTVVMPTLDRVDRAAWRRLRDIAEWGASGASGASGEPSGPVIVLGPRRPTRDERGCPLGDDAPLPAGAGLIRAASADDLDGLADDLEALAGDLDDAWTTSADDVDCSVFVTADGAPRVVFVAHRRGAVQRVDVRVPLDAVITDALSGERIAVAVADAGDDADGADEVLGVIDVDLSAFEVRMFTIA